MEWICYMRVHWVIAEEDNHGSGGRVVDTILTNAFGQCMVASSAVLAAWLGDEFLAQLCNNPDHRHVQLLQLMTQNNP